jgi:energy-coupling factor transporter ATP-binding protein EcfA2
MIDTHAPALHVADRHDLIRVHGARVNNLKDVSVEIPTRRLTMFTGVSGSGKSVIVIEHHQAVTAHATGSSTSMTAAGSSSRADPPTSSPPFPPLPVSTSRPTSAPDLGPSSGGAQGSNLG